MTKIEAQFAVQIKEDNKTVDIVGRTTIYVPAAEYNPQPGNGIKWFQDIYKKGYRGQTIMKYSIYDFAICSTEVDIMLFTNNSYVKALTKAVNLVLADIDITGRELLLIPHRSIVEFKDNKDDSFYLYHIIGPYKE